MANSTIIETNSPLFKVVEYRASYSISSSSRQGKIAASSFLDKNGNAYSPTLDGGFNVIGFCGVSSGSQHCAINEINMLASGSTRLMRVIDKRAASSTASPTAIVYAFYMRANINTN